MGSTARLATALAVTALLWPAVSVAQEAAEVARGARVYSTTCGRCHNLRPATERTDAEWVTIVAQMRARATMSRSDARAVLSFLQATNYPEGRPTAWAPRPTPAPSEEQTDEPNPEDP